MKNTSQPIFPAWCGHCRWAVAQPPYDATFWFSYAANFLLTVAVTMLFRYADFVALLGGTELELGLIVGVGMVGALASRTLQGSAIDRFGARRVWICFLILFALSVLGHLAVSRADGVGVYVARIALMTSTAGAYGASLTYIALRAPRARMGEMIGTIGTSGFVGMGVGPAIGDWLLGVQNVSRAQIMHVFLAAAGISVLTLLFVAMTAPDRPRRSRRRQPPLWAVLRRYHPGSLLLVAAGGGLALGLPNTFLNAYANELKIPGIRTFFLVYASVAFAVRILTRNLADRAGPRPVAFWGLIWAAGATLSFVVVWDAWSMIIPALPLGIAHACLFPAVMAGGHACFPDRYRGLATTLMLAGFDVGSLIGQPAVGGIIDAARKAHLPPYPLMFGFVSLCLAVIAAIYAFRTRPQKKPSPAGNA